MERKTYEVVMEGGKLFYKQTGELLDTTAESKDKWIFVLSTTKNLYVGKKKKGTFQHSSFLAGGAASAAGRLVVENGTLKVYIHESFLDSHLFTCSSLEIVLFPNFYLLFFMILQAIWPHSGHYRPTEENFQDFLSFLRENSVDITDVKVKQQEEKKNQRFSVCLVHIFENTENTILVFLL